MSRLKPLVIILAIVVLILGAGGVYYVNGLGAVDPDNSEEISVTVPQGSGASSIVEILDDQGLIKNKTVAKVQARIGRYSSLQANTYIFSKSIGSIHRPLTMTSKCK